MAIRYMGEKMTGMFWQRMAWILPLIAAMVYIPYLNSGLLFPDEREYYAIAHNLISAGFYSIDGVTATAYRPPGYPLFLAAMMMISSNVIWLKAIGLLLWAASGLLTIRIVKILYGDHAQIYAAIMFCLYGVGLYTASTLYPQTLASFLLVASIYLLLRFPPEKAAIPVVLMQGIAVMAIPNFLFILPLFLIVLARSRQATWRIALGLVILSSLSTPWVIRNYMMFDRFIPLSTSGGINLLTGNSEKTTANAGVNVDLSHYQSVAAGMSETQRDDYFSNAAKEWIASNPLRASELFFAKFLNWFNFQNELATSVGGATAKALILALTYYPILLLAGLSVLMVPTTVVLPRWFFPTLYVVAAVSYAVFFTRIRFRVPFDGILIILSVGFIEQMLRREITKIRFFLRPKKTS